MVVVGKGGVNQATKFFFTAVPDICGGGGGPQYKT
jgi:hypothetical protein